MRRDAGYGSGRVDVVDRRTPGCERSGLAGKAGDVVSVLLPVLGVLIIIAASAALIRLAVTDQFREAPEPEEPDDQDGGGGGGPRGRDPLFPRPPGGSDPEWWPVFERQFAEYVAREPVA